MSAIVFKTAASLRPWVTSFSYTIHVNHHLFQKCYTIFIQNVSPERNSPTFIQITKPRHLAFWQLNGKWTLPKTFCFLSFFLSFLRRKWTETWTAPFKELNLNEISKCEEQKKKTFTGLCSCCSSVVYVRKTVLSCKIQTGHDNICMCRSFSSKVLPVQIHWAS